MYCFGMGSICSYIHFISLILIASIISSVMMLEKPIVMIVSVFPSCTWDLDLDCGI